LKQICHSIDKIRYIPFRDSVFTQTLSQKLLGSSQCVFAIQTVNTISSTDDILLGFLRLMQDLRIESSQTLVYNEELDQIQYDLEMDLQAEIVLGDQLDLQISLASGRNQKTFSNYDEKLEASAWLYEDDVTKTIEKFCKKMRHIIKETLNSGSLSYSAECWSILDLVVKDCSEELAWKVVMHRFKLNEIEEVLRCDADSSGITIRMIDHLKFYMDHVRIQIAMCFAIFLTELVSITLQVVINSHSFGLKMEDVTEYHFREETKRRLCENLSFKLSSLVDVLFPIEEECDEFPCLY
jgi:hypothetical protein